MKAVDSSPSSQSTFSPLLIGSGKLAHHLHAYLNLLGIPHETWTKPRDLFGLKEKLESRTHLWLLVSDHALPDLSEILHSRFPGVPLIHSSATTELKGALTLHPLMTFGPTLYSKERYETIPFTLFWDESESAPGFETLIRSRFPNPLLSLASKDRARYHLNCVMISNLSILLWSAGMRAGPDLPRAAFHPILSQTLNNFMEHGESALTGPLQRNDQATLKKHLELLSGKPEKRLYETFMDYFYDDRT